MPCRWILCPVVSRFVAGHGTGRWPLVADLVDVGRVPQPGTDDDGRPTLLPKGFNLSAVISDGQPGEINNWCLCFVRYVDASTLDEQAAANPAFVNVLERDYEDGDNFLARSPTTDGWSPQRVTRLKTIVNARGSAGGLNASSPFWAWLARLGSVIRPGFEPRGTWVG